MSSLLVKSIPLEDEYKKPTGITPEDIARLREWLSSQPHLPSEHITDLDLILCYHSCKNDLAMAKQTLDIHFTLKTQFTTLFKDRCFDSYMESVFSKLIIRPLQARGSNGEAIYYGRLLDTDAKNFVMQDTLRAVLMALDLWQYEDGTWPGFIIIFDLDGLKLGHVLKIDLVLVKQFLQYLEQAMLVQIKSIHLLNAASFWNYLMSILKKFVKSDMLKLLQVHLPGSNTLGDFLPIDILPKEAGGNTKTFKECQDEMFSRMKANNDYFLLENKKRVTESLRP